MALHDLLTRARTKFAASAVATKVSAAFGTMSGYAFARKALKRAGNDENAGSNVQEFSSSLEAPGAPQYVADEDNNLNQMLQSATTGHGLDALSTPPLPSDGDRTRYSPPDKKQTDQELTPKPLKIRDTNCPDDKDRETSFSDMLKTNPLEEITPLKGKTGTSAVSPTIKNGQRLEGGHKNDTYPRIKTNAQATELNPLGFRESNPTEGVGDGSTEMAPLRRAMTDPFEETKPTKETAKTTQVWEPFAMSRMQQAHFRERQRELADKYGSNDKKDQFSLRALEMTNPTYEKAVISPSYTRFQVESPFSTPRRKVTSAFSKETSDLTMTPNVPTHSMLSQSKSRERKRLLATIKESPTTYQTFPRQGREVLYDAEASKLSGRYEFAIHDVDSDTWSTPSAKRTTRKNVLTVDTIKASIKAGVMSQKSPNLKKGKLEAGSKPKPMYRLPGAPEPIYPQGGPSAKQVGASSGGQSSKDIYPSDSSRTVWPETEPDEELQEEAEEVGKVFFFEDFHGENIVKSKAGKGTEQTSGQSSSKQVINNGEVKVEATAIADSSSDYSSDHSTIQGISTICQDINQAISEMDEATRHEQATRKDEAARKEADARQTKENEDTRACRVDELRKNTGTEVVLYAESDLRPKHPNHGRKWNAKNLFCTNCQGNCAVCNAPCCVLMKAIIGMTEIKDQADLTYEEDQICLLARSIDSLVGEHGVDEPTFIRCTQCFKFVCPDCCSQCPVFPCHDCTCRKCNLEGQWKCCKYHDKTDIPDHIKPYQRFQHQRM